MDSESASLIPSSGLTLNVHPLEESSMLTPLGLSLRQMRSVIVDLSQRFNDGLPSVYDFVVVMMLLFQVRCQSLPMPLHAL
jgi:hypothetical protein